MERLRKSFSRMMPNDNKNTNSISSCSGVNNASSSNPRRRKEENANELETDFKETKFSYTWRVKNIQLCGLKTNEFLESPTFTTRFCGEITWALRLYPRGLQPPNTLKFCKRHFYPQFNVPLGEADSCEKTGLFLCRISNHRVNTFMKYRLVCERHMSSSQDTLYHPSEEDLEIINLDTTDESEYGIENLFCRYGFEGPETLVIRCDIYIIGVFNTGGASNCDVGTFKSDTLIQDLQKMLETGTLSDITLEARNVRFPAHKSVLASRSEVFAAMFIHGMKEAHTNVIQIKDIDPATLKSLLQYIYTGYVEDFDLEKAMSLYSAADKYLMKELKNLCIDMMLSHMTLDNVCHIAVLADLHPDPGLKTATLSMFLNHTSKIFKRKEWKDLVGDANHNALVSEILAYVLSGVTTDCEDK